MPCPDCGWTEYNPAIHQPCGSTAFPHIEDDDVLSDFEYPEDYGYAYGDLEDDCRG